MMAQPNQDSRQDVRSFAATDKASEHNSNWRRRTRLNATLSRSCLISKIDSFLPFLLAAALLAVVLNGRQSALTKPDGPD